MDINFGKELKVFHTFRRYCNNYK